METLTIFRLKGCKKKKLKLMHFWVGDKVEHETEVLADLFYHTHGHIPSSQDPTKKALKVINKVKMYLKKEV